MSNEMSPAEAAYTAYHRALDHYPKWDVMTSRDKASWMAAAQAVASRLQDANDNLQTERNMLAQRCAEAVAERDRLAAEVADVRKFAEFEATKARDYAEQIRELTEALAAVRGES
jgi:hypothetical protein